MKRPGSWKMNYLLIGALVATALAVLGIVAHVVEAGPATWTNYDTYCLDSNIIGNTDCFRNWDSNDPSSFLPSTADWPVTLVYTNDAEVDKIKLSYGWLIGLGNSMYMYMTDDGVNWFVDSDRGIKTVHNFNGLTVCNMSLGYEYVHIRLYANPDTDYNTDPLSGHYVIVTSHLDSFPFESWSGFPYLAEYEANMRAIELGWGGIPDSINLHNADLECRISGSHINLNDGYASWIIVPP